jgi:phosphatidylinositol phospholipase C delta
MEMAHTTNEPTDWNRIDKNLFEAHLLANENDAFDPDRENYDETDMHQPLSEYWINSSHNTYLIGHQITSHSSVEMYSNALYRGARCLEVDIWDGERSSNGTPVPVVWHGHTMTTKIYFVDIIKTIKVFLNFHPDTFPIVLSFENHCSIPYQEVMAEQLLRILGDLLYIPTEASLYGRLPSPAQLRGLVVIKGRRPIGTEADAYDTDDDSDEDGPTVTSSMGDLTRDGLAQENAVKKHGIAPQLARLTLLHGTKYKSWGESTRMPTHHMHSVSESKVRSLCRHKSSHHWIVFNQAHMSRTYPSGSRVDSSNYNPLLAWSTGCQMVALNFQTEDAFLRLNDGRFRENGSCGYVLKPSSLMMKDDFSHTSASVRLSIRVLSASCLPKPKGQRSGDCIDPYVKVSVFDVKNEEKETITSYPTSVVPSNGFFPIWGQEKFAFVVENGAVALLQVTVYDKAKDDFIGSSTIPISCLRRGIRSVKLYDATNTRSGAFDFASLLLDVKIGQVVAEI